MKPTAPTPAADLMAQLAATRGEVAEAAARSRALRRQMQAEGLAQAAAMAQRGGNDSQAEALLDDARRLSGVDVKA